LVAGTHTLPAPRKTDPANDNNVKTETQEEDEKVRQIGAPSADHKFVIGPVMKFLQEALSTLKYWGVGKSFRQKQMQYNVWKGLGFSGSFTLDISGLDQSHNPIVKYLWNKIVTWLVKSGLIHHVAPATFEKYAGKNTTIGKFSINGRKEGEVIELIAIELWEKMMSGQGYTTILNTLLMCSILSFIEYRSKLIMDGTVAGDDASIVSGENRDKIIACFAEVFSSKADMDNPRGLGLMLKYLRVGELVDATPCSTELFDCPRCGIKMVRMLEKVIYNTPYSMKAMNCSIKQRKNLMAAIAECGLAMGGRLPILDAYFKRLRFGITPDYNVLPDSYNHITLELDHPPYFKEEVLNQKEKWMRAWNHTGNFIDRENSFCHDCPKAYAERLLVKYGLTPTCIALIEETIWQWTFEKHDYDLLNQAFAIGKAYLERLNVTVNLPEPISHLKNVLNKQDFDWLLQPVMYQKNKAKLPGTKLGIYLILGQAISLNCQGENEASTSKFAREIFNYALDIGLFQHVPVEIAGEVYYPKIANSLDCDRLDKLLDYMDSLGYKTKSHIYYQVNALGLPTTLWKTSYPDYRHRDDPNFNLGNEYPWHMHRCKHCYNHYLHKHDMLMPANQKRLNKYTGQYDTIPITKEEKVMAMRKDHSQFEGQCPWEECTHYYAEFKNNGNPLDSKGNPYSMNSTQAAKVFIEYNLGEASEKPPKNLGSAQH